MPYVRDQFYSKVSPLADIVELSSNSHEELERDFETKYAGVQAIYHSRDPGSFFGNLEAEFFKRVPKTCKVVCHRESYILYELISSRCGLRRCGCRSCKAEWYPGKSTLRF